jgi:small subunit ribosomal protein S5
MADNQNETSKPAPAAASSAPAPAAATTPGAPASAAPGATTPGAPGGAPANTGDDRRGGFQGGGRGDGRGRGRGRGRGARQAPPKPMTDDGKELHEKVVFINRCATATKGGRRFSFSALMVSGDKDGRVGVGFGKAKEVAECIRKGSEDAKRTLVRMKIVKGTIPHEVQAEHGGGVVLLKPACPGTGIIAGGGVRAVCEAVGITDILGKSLGSNNHANVVKATMNALSQLRTREEVLESRGKKVKESL